MGRGQKSVSSFRSTPAQPKAFQACPWPAHSPANRRHQGGLNHNGRKSEKPQDSKIIFRNPHRRIPDEAHRAGFHIR